MQLSRIGMVELREAGLAKSLHAVDGPLFQTYRKWSAPSKNDKKKKHKESMILRGLIREGFGSYIAAKLAGFHARNYPTIAKVEKGLASAAAGPVSGVEDVAQEFIPDAVKHIPAARSMKNRFASTNRAKNEAAANSAKLKKLRDKLAQDRDQRVFAKNRAKTIKGTPRTGGIGVRGQESAVRKACLAEASVKVQGFNHQGTMVQPVKDAIKNVVSAGKKHLNRFSRHPSVPVSDPWNRKGIDWLAQRSRAKQSLTTLKNKAWGAGTVGVGVVGAGTAAALGAPLAQDQYESIGIVGRSILMETIRLAGRGLVEDPSGIAYWTGGARTPKNTVMTSQRGKRAWLNHNSRRRNIELQAATDEIGDFEPEFVRPGFARARFRNTQNVARKERGIPENQYHGKE